VPYALYAPADFGPLGDSVPVVVMDTGFGGMPDVGWLMQSLPAARIVARSNSREMQAQLCALGTGLAVLPKPLAAATPGLVEVDLGSDPPSRETWLGYHRDMKRLPRLRALVDLMVESVAFR